MPGKSTLKNSVTSLMTAIALAAPAALALSGSVALRTAEVRSAGSAFEQHVKYLSSGELAGRAVGTPGVRLARDYIAAELARLGLKPGGDNSSYFQSFEVTVGVTVEPPSSLVFGGEPSGLSRDWVPLGLSGSGKAAGEIVFVGYGITAKEHGYDDYAGVDVKGKIALVLRYEPPPRDASSPFKKFPDYSIHSALRTKANNARDHGAVGMILIDLNHDADAELLPIRSTLWRGGRTLIAAQMKRDVVERHLAERGISLSALKEKIDRSQAPAPMHFPGLTATMEITLGELRDRTDNVVAVLAGTSRGRENVVIGAHYDHLGFGYYGARDAGAAGTMHPGADDNASGTAVLLELARRFAQAPPARTLVFVAFSAEELGLHGSRHFVENPSAGGAISAMINLDMVGRLRDRLTVFGARSGGGLSGIVNNAAQRLGLTLAESDDIGRSDHLAFYNKKIPVLHFFTGIHEDYHRPSDTWTKLNYPGMARVADLVERTVEQIANSPEPIAFASLGRPPTQSLDFPEPPVSTYLGTIPDYGSNAVGVKLAGISEGSPAALAGLQAGDVIIRVATADIRTIEGLTAALAAQKPGDQVVITVLRSGRPLSLNAILRTRRQQK